MKKKCVYFIIFVVIIFNFVSCSRKDYYTDFRFEICIYKDFEKEIPDKTTFYSSGSYSDNTCSRDSIEISLQKCSLHFKNEDFLCKSFYSPFSCHFDLYVAEKQEKILKLLNEGNKGLLSLSLGDEEDFSDMRISDGKLYDLDDCYSYRYLVFLKKPVQNLRLHIVSDFYIKRYQE